MHLQNIGPIPHNEIPLVQYFDPWEIALYTMDAIPNFFGSLYLKV